MRAIIAAALLLATSHAALALRDLPRNDVLALCKRAANGDFKPYPADAKPTPQESYVACVDGEQAAYDWIKDRWPPMSENWREECNRESGNTISGTHRVIRACMEKKFAIRDENLRKDRERQAAEPVMPKKEFRY
jgi:hypothetical protein